jgi:hypothetical protein
MGYSIQMSLAERLGKQLGDEPLLFPHTAHPLFRYVDVEKEFEEGELIQVEKGRLG